MNLIQFKLCVTLVVLLMLHSVLAQANDNSNINYDDESLPLEQIMDASDVPPVKKEERKATVTPAKTKLRQPFVPIFHNNMAGSAGFPLANGLFSAPLFGQPLDAQADSTSNKVVLVLNNDKNKFSNPVEESLKRITRNPDLMEDIVAQFQQLGGGMAQQFLQQISQTAPDLSRTFGQALNEALTQTNLLAQVAPGAIDLGELGQSLSQSFLLGATQNALNATKTQTSLAKQASGETDTQNVGSDGSEAQPTKDPKTVDSQTRKNPFEPIVGKPLFPFLPKLKFAPFGMLGPLYALSPLTPLGSEISEVRVLPEQHYAPYKISPKSINHQPIAEMKLRTVLKESLNKKTIPILWFHLPNHKHLEKTNQDMEMEEKLEIFEKQVIAELRQLQDLSKMANEFKKAQLDSGIQPNTSLTTKLKLFEIPIYDITLGDIEKTLNDEHVQLLMQTIVQKQNKEFQRHQQATTKYLTDLTGTPIKRQVKSDDDALKTLEKDDMMKIMMYAYRMAAMHGHDMPWLRNMTMPNERGTSKASMDAKEEQMVDERQWLNDKQQIHMAMEAEKQWRMNKDEEQRNYWSNPYMMQQQRQMMSPEMQQQMFPHMQQQMPMLREMMAPESQQKMPSDMQQQMPMQREMMAPEMKQQMPPAMQQQMPMHREMFPHMQQQMPLQGESKQQMPPAMQQKMPMHREMFPHMPQQMPMQREMMAPEMKQQMPPAMQQQMPMHKEMFPHMPQQMPMQREMMAPEMKQQMPPAMQQQMPPTMQQQMPPTMQQEIPMHREMFPHMPQQMPLQREMMAPEIQQQMPPAMQQEMPMHREMFPHMQQQMPLQGKMKQQMPPTLQQQMPPTMQQEMPMHREMFPHMPQQMPLQREMMAPEMKQQMPPAMQQQMPMHREMFPQIPMQIEMMAPEIQQQMLSAQQQQMPKQREMMTPEMMRPRQMSAQKQMQNQMTPQMQRNMQFQRDMMPNQMQNHLIDSNMTPQQQHFQTLMVQQRMMVNSNVPQQPDNTKAMRAAEQNQTAESNKPEQSTDIKAETPKLTNPQQQADMHMGNKPQEAKDSASARHIGNPLDFGELFDNLNVFNLNKKKSKPATIINYYYNTEGNRYPGRGYYPTQTYGKARDMQNTFVNHYHHEPNPAADSARGSNAYGSSFSGYRTAVGDEEIAAMLREDQSNHVSGNLMINK